MPGRVSVWSGGEMCSFRKRGRRLRRKREGRVGGALGELLFREEPGKGGRWWWGKRQKRQRGS